MIASRHVVAQQGRWLITIHDQDVEVAIVIKVAEGGTATDMTCGDVRARLISKLGEGSVALITENQTWVARRILGIHSLKLGSNSARDNENVWVPVIVQVNQPCAPTAETAFGAEPRPQRNIFKFGLATVVIEARSLIHKMRFEQIDMAIEIVVADADP